MQPPMQLPDRPGGRRAGAGWLRPVSLALLGMVFVASAGSLLGSAHYELARGAVMADDFASADRHLDAARALDPGLALYPRAQGAVRLTLGDTERAIASLRAAIARAPIDDQAWRLLALAHEQGGDAAASSAALETALGLQRSDPTNLLLTARLGGPTGSRETIAEIVQAWPLILAAPGWDAFTPIPSAEALELAIERWNRDQETPEREVEQPILLVALGGRSDLLDRALAATPLSRALATALDASARCDPGTADRLEALADADRRVPLAWALRARDAEAGSVQERDALRAYRIMAGRRLDDGGAAGSLSPLDGNDLADFSLDEWGYRRAAFPSLDWSFRLPSPNAGRQAWYLAAPGSAAATIGEGCGP